MKKLKLLIVSVFTAILMMPLVHAASGTISVSGANQVVSGNKLTVTVTISSGAAIGSWQMNLNYDKSYLQLLSATSEAGGTMMANSSATGVTKKSYTFTFKTLKTGSTKLSVTSALAYAFSDLSQISLSTGSKTVKIITQAELEASYSKDNNLKSLSVEGFEISPAFSKDVLEYNVVVPENTKTVKINASASDSKSTVSGIGEKEVSLGTNAFDIVVKAENGSEKTYKIKVEVKDSNPITVDVDGNKATIVKVRDFLEAPLEFTESTVVIDGVEIPSYKNEKAGIELVGLKDSEGNIALYSYDDSNGTYTKYDAIKTNGVTILPIETKDSINGYQKYIEKIGENEISVYKTKKDSRFSLIYGMDLLSGEKGYYMYDSKLNTLIAYNTEMIEQLQTQNQLFMYLIIGFSVILISLFIIVINMHNKRKRLIKEIENVKKPRRKREEIIEL